MVGLGMETRDLLTASTVEQSVSSLDGIVDSLVISGQMKQRSSMISKTYIGALIFVDLISCQPSAIFMRIVRDNLPKTKSAAIAHHQRPQTRNSLMRVLPDQRHLIE